MLQSRARRQLELATANLAVIQSPNSSGVNINQLHTQQESQLNTNQQSTSSLNNNNLQIITTTAVVPQRSASPVAINTLSDTTPREKLVLPQSA